MLGLADLDCIVVGLNGAGELEQIRALTEGAGLARTVPVVAVGDEPAAVGGLAALRRGADEYVERANADSESLAATVLLAVERQRLRSAELPILDPLTGLPNRILFKDRLRTALARRRRTGEDVIVIFIDLDGFKEVNDTHGHAAGDFLLVEIARRLARSFRSTDTVARYGGDEFAVLCEGPNVATHLELLREQVQRSFLAPIDLGDKPVPVAASVGTALAGDETEPELLLERADAAMYEAKRAGASPERSGTA